ncbi:MAG: protein kinase [Planctomycetota bacterium]
MQQLGPYRLHEELGRGGMGVVFRATDLRSGQAVALKVLLDPDSVSVERFRREAGLVRGLSHPSLIRVHELSLAPPHPYAAFELVEGETLKRRVEREGPLPWGEAARAVGEVAQALEVAHARGLLHRDVKPHNVILGAERAKLADFGVVKELDAQSLTATGALVGTPSYLSPEQALGDKARLGPASDVYGLGATLYFALSGAPPFRGPTLVATLEQVVAAPVPPLRGAQVPPALEAVCRRALAKEPAARFASAGAFAEALEEAARAPAVGRGRGLAAALAAASVGLALAVWVATRGGGEGAPTQDAVTEQVVELRRLAQGGDAAAVEAALDDLERRFPDSFKPSRERGLWLRQQNRLEEAERAFGESLEREASAELYARRAEVRGVRGDAEGAERDLERALELDPEHGLSWFLRGRGQLLRGDYASARASFERALAQGQTEVAVYAGWVAALQELHDPAGLAHALKQGLERYPTSSPLLVARARQARETGDYAGALADLSLAEAVETSAELLLERALVYLEQRNFDAARVCVVRATEFDPRSLRALDLRARLSDQRGDLDDARGCLERLLQLDPEDRVAREHLAQVHLARADFRAGEEEAEELLARDRRSWLAYALRGRARLQLGRAAEAEADFERALALQERPGYQTFVGLADALAARRALGPAVDALGGALEAAPPEAQAHLYAMRARLRVALWRLEPSVADATRAWELDPRRGDALATRAEAYLKLERYEEALADCRLARRIDPQQRFATVGEVLALLGLGRDEDALAFAEAEVRRAPASTVDCLRAEALWKVGRRDEARSVLEPHFAGGRVELLALLIRATWRLEEGDWARGIADCGLALTDANVSPLHLRALHQVWLRLGFGLAGGAR